MKATELRIGNWITSLGRIEQAVDILCDSVSTVNSECVPYDLIEPIPLTKDWLLKFGFERHHGDYFNEVIMLKDVININNGDIAESFNFKLFPNEMGSAQGVARGVKLKHVHQLQNLYFALTNKELEL